MLLSLDLKTSLVQKSCISWHLPLYLCFPSSNFCIFASGSCLLHQNKVTSALLMVCSVFQELEHQEKTRPWVILAQELFPKALKKPTKNIFSSTNSRNPSARIYIHTLQRECFWEGCITECMQGSWRLCTFIEYFSYFPPLSNHNDIIFSRELFFSSSFTWVPPAITFLVSLTHSPLKKCTVLKNPGSPNGRDNRPVEQVQQSQPAADFTVRLPSLCWTFSFSAQPTCR